MNRTSFVLCVAAMLVVAQSSAGIVTYSNRATFEADCPNRTTMTFNGVAAPGSYTQYGDAVNPGVYTESGLTLADQHLPLYAVNATWGFNPGVEVMNPSGPAVVDLTGFGTGTRAAGFDLYHRVDAEPGK